MSLFLNFFDLYIIMKNTRKQYFFSAGLDIFSSVPDFAFLCFARHAY